MAQAGNNSLPAVKTLSLGFNRAYDYQVPGADAYKKDPSKLSIEEKKREKFRQFMEKDLEDRENQKKNAKKLDNVHPFDLSPKKHLLRERPAASSQEVYEGLNIGVNSLDMSKEKKRQIMLERNKRLKEDEERSKSIKKFNETDEAYTMGRKPFERKIADGTDIDPNCQLLKLGVDEDTILKKKEKERELMMDNIAVANMKQESDKTLAEPPNDFCIGSEGSLAHDKQSKVAYKAMLDEDAKNFGNSNKSNKKQGGGERVLQESMSRMINYTGLTGLNIGSGNDIALAEKMRQREKYKAELDEQTQYSEYLKKVEKEATKYHFSGKAPYEQEQH